MATIRFISLSAVFGGIIMSARLYVYLLAIACIHAPSGRGRSVRGFFFLHGKDF